MVLILGAVVLSATGQLLLKSGAQRLARLDRLEFFIAAAGDIRVVMAVAAWIAWTTCWLYVLRLAPLSRAYALTSLTYVLVPLASGYFFDEQLRLPQIAGFILIGVGIACVLTGD
jgi:undecaprenyl phosphate-alpha-L-ara4N flippase subunit ArnF